MVLHIISIVQILLLHCDNSFNYMIILTLTLSKFLMLLNASHFLAKFMFITQQLQGFMLQAISVEQVDCNSNTSTQLSMVLHTTIQSLLYLTNQNLAWKEWTLLVFSCSFLSVTAIKISCVHLLIGLFTLMRSQMKTSGCGL
jgi:hypothetical protein